VLAALLGRWGIGDGVHVVAYDDQGGAFAARLWWLLGWLGHDDVAVLEGGWSAWLRAGGDVEQGVGRARPAREFTARCRPERVVDATLLEREAGALRLLDARTSDRFAGENEAIDPVGGHIPGARSLPWSSLVGVDKRLATTGEIEARIDAALDGVAPERAVLYCGSGVTACFDLLVMAHVGRAGARLYPGSWSEWITDGRRGVARGAR
jgi:thiosulfate/3-mercaptopyruvate sulfurtransferase